MVTPTDGAAWLDSPIYLSGLMKTGSTLLLALLDGHSQVLTYPDEPSFERIFHRSYLSHQHLALDWLFGTANPLHFGPTLERQGRLPGAYQLKSWSPIPADFDFTSLDLATLRQSIRLRGLSEQDQLDAIDLEGYLSLLQARLEGHASLTRRDVVLITMSTLFESLRMPIRPSCWLFKHPLARYRESSFEWFFSAFPKGRAVILMRDPRAYLHSLEGHQSERGLKNTGSTKRFATFFRRLTELERDYASFARLPDLYGADRVLLAYYEDVVGDTRSAATAITQWMGLPFEDVLLVPTKLGRPVMVPTATRPESNMVYTGSADRWRTEMSKTRQVLAEAATDGFLSSHQNRYEPSAPAALRAIVRPCLAPPLWIVRTFAPMTRPVLGTDEMQRTP